VFLGWAQWRIGLKKLNIKVDLPIRLSADRSDLIWDQQQAARLKNQAEKYRPSIGLVKNLN
jgi:hypothetical protein